ncbi:unnamed protein product [Toxocara canis]|uniref:FAS-associated factor 1 n=1 Tax=Toxocara canis TaxID=6265 RepID=A0A183UB77_TOXCA|nr:unnamed protein product [Toxocara canis]
MGDRRRAVIELSGGQKTLLERYQEIANESDKRKAIEAMESVDWDLQRAVEMRLAGDPVGDYTTPRGELSHNGEDDIDDDDLMWDAVSESYNGLTHERNHKFSSSSRTKGSSLWDGASSSQHSAATPVLESRSGSGSQGQIRSRSMHNDSAISGTGDDAALDRDSDSDGFDGQMEVEDDRASSKCEERAPLVPSDFTSIEEAMNNFTVVFEARYGYNHAPFYAGSLRDAIREAFEAPGRAISERRPLVIYLHNDNAVASNIFAKNVLCSDSVASLLNGQFITWGWDITQKANKEMLLSWLEWSDVRETTRVLRKTLYDQYPLLLIITKDAGVVQMFDMCSGFDRADDVMQKLMNSLEFYQRIRSIEETEEKQRQEREMIRQEQKREYEESLARDRAHQEELERQKQEQQEEEVRRQRAEEKKADRMRKLASSLPKEPAATEKGIVMVRMRFPDGFAEVRRFRASEPLNNLATYIESKGYDMEHFRVWNSDVPKKNVMECFDLSHSFADLKWPVREQVFVEEK